MDDAAARVNPKDLQRLEKARQRREDRAQTELQAKARAEREREQALKTAQMQKNAAVQYRQDPAGAPRSIWF